MTASEHIDRLDQRRRYLAERIKAKQTVGWDVGYDQSEHDALTWALARLTSATVATGEQLVEAINRAAPGAVIAVVSGATITGETNL